VETKDELAEEFKKALEAIPGLDYEFTQPIEMRFNELITGVRADLAIKVFGEDLDVLLKTAQEIEAAIQGVEGAADIILEKVDGLPQMKIEYDRAKIAKYGLNVEDLNQVVTMGFAGLSTGTVFEGEKQFELVVRFAETYRKDISHLENAAIQLPTGGAVPLHELAKISYTEGPAKISRDNTQRRVVIGVNVRNRDLQSVVDDIQGIVNKINIPEGYRVDYGGQFENLQQARTRLMIAVPVALILIFILLYFAFSSARDAFMIYTAIPFSAIGGVLLLWMRDMPFSISAGVGFIALFGIAVLNGIVMIEHFKSMKDKFTSIRQLVVVGAKERLRPVLLTASAAALGFLPMAVSGSAGAEVQRPLATVVVGGLISATLLTLVVLPVLYVLFNSRKEEGTKFSKNALMLLVLLTGMSFPAFSQTEVQKLSLSQALEIAQEQNLSLLAAQKGVESASARSHAGWTIDKTQVYYGFDKNDIAENGVYNRVWGVRQSIAFPSVYSAQKNVLQAVEMQQNAQLQLSSRALSKEVSQAFVTALYWKELERNYSFLDSLYGEFARAATRRLETGESNLLEKLTAESKLREIDLKKAEAGRGVEISTNQLRQLLNIEEEIELVEEDFSFDEQVDLENHPAMMLYQSAYLQAESQTKVDRRTLLPDVNVDLFRGTNPGEDARIYPGFQAGIGIPLFFGSQSAKIKAGRFQQEQIMLESEAFKQKLQTNYSKIQTSLAQNRQVIEYYESDGNTLSVQLRDQAIRSFKEGEIDFLQYVQLIENSRNITLQYLQAKLDYQLNQLELIYLNN
ncbi:MAG TPA: efflux RND transporter permease subunit, partial [Algoriphagus sp.]|nr:efflux RND transporter permease subunit [Algoriphagus sp.]